MPTDGRKYFDRSQPYQHCQTSHRPPQLPTGHHPISRVFQLVAIEILEHNAPSGGKRYILSVINHLTQFLVLIPITDETAITIVRNLVDHAISVCGPLETLHLGQGTGFANTLSQRGAKRFRAQQNPHCRVSFMVRQCCGTVSRQTGRVNSVGVKPLTAQWVQQPLDIGLQTRCRTILEVGA